MISGRHRRWLDYAINTACSSSYSRWWLGAVIVRGGSVLSTGVNSARTAPSLLSSKEIVVGRASEHAEMAALRKCGDADDATLYVARVTPTGLVGASKPCQTCMASIIKSGIKQVIHTDSFGKVGVIKL